MARSGWWRSFTVSVMFKDVSWLGKSRRMTIHHHLSIHLSTFLALNRPRGALRLVEIINEISEERIAELQAGLEKVHKLRAFNNLFS